MGHVAHLQYFLIGLTMLRLCMSEGEHPKPPSCPTAPAAPIAPAPLGSSPRVVDPFWLDATAPGFPGSLPLAGPALAVFRQPLVPFLSP